jgi:hypothetical protein
MSFSFSSSRLFYAGGLNGAAEGESSGLRRSGVTPVGFWPTAGTKAVPHVMATKSKPATIAGLMFT